MIVRMNDPRTRQWLTLTAALDRTMREHAPGWTDYNGPDPDVTMLELIAFLAEDLQRNARVVEGGGPALSRAIRARSSSSKPMTPDAASSRPVSSRKARTARTTGIRNRSFARGWR